MRKLIAVFDLSSSAANSWFGFANIILIVGALLVLVGTVMVAWTGSIRDRYTEERTLHHEADIAAANAQAEHAKLEAAKANDSAARANLAAEIERVARLQLEAKLADRVITPEHQQKLIKSMSQFRGQTIDAIVLGGGSEIAAFSQVLLDSLLRAGILLNIERSSGSDVGARGVLVGVKSGSPEDVVRLGHSLMIGLRDALGSGVAEWPYEKVPFPNGAIYAQSTPGATPTGTSPIRLVIGGK